MSCSNKFMRAFNTFNPLFSFIMSKHGTCFYAVKRGRVPGVYSSWPECESQVKGFINPAFKKFSSHEDATNFISGSGMTSSKTADTKIPNGCSDQKTEPTDFASLGKAVAEIKASMHQMLGLVQNLSSDLAEVRSSVTRLEQHFIFAPGSKRHFSSSAETAGDTEMKNKRPKFSLEEERFTGRKFEEKDGTHVYTDGGCFDNGRNGARAGLGVYWTENDKDNISEKLPGRPTNNRAEIHAAVRALQVAKKKGIKNLILHTDSQFLINGITKWIKGWKRNQWTLTTGKPVINKEDFEELDKELQGMNVKWVYVRGHSGDPANEAADKLAKQGAEKTV